MKNSEAPKRSIATQNTAAVRKPRAWSDYFGGPFLWFVSFGQAKEMNTRAGQITRLTILYSPTPKKTALNEKWKKQK